MTQNSVLGPTDADVPGRNTQRRSARPDAKTWGRLLALAAKITGCLPINFWASHIGALL